MKRIKLALLLLLLSCMALLSACGSDYRIIASENVITRMTEMHDCTVVDARSPEAYAEGHVPDAINIPADTVGDGEIEALPAKDLPIIVYGESESAGNQAAKRLADLGYEKVFTFGGISAWRGDVVKEEDPEHVHLFNEKATTAQFFVKDATRDEAAIFRYSCACGEGARYKTFTHGRKTSELLSVGKKADLLDGKKILFAGNSFNYYGKTVNYVDGGVTEQAARMNDTGYFYELCKQNGAEVNVTNWSFGSHTLSDIFSSSCAADKECTAGHDHLADLTDRNYDYVSLMDMNRAAGMNEDEYIAKIKSFMKLFTDVNPDCKFIFSIPSGAYWYNHQDKLGAYDYVTFAAKLAELDNVIVIDWGRLVYDLVKRDTLLPDSTVRCTESSLITPDGNQPNLLSGYIHAVMTYCAITGETAVGQPTMLENGTETGFALRFQMDSYIEKIYKGKSTNFVGILSSEEEMKNVQQLINRYMDMESYRHYK